MNASRIAIAVVVLLLGTWTGLKMYGYFFDTDAPAITVGLTPDGYYSGDVQCLINGSDAYKVGTISVWLDERPILSGFRVGKRNFEYSLPIPTKTLANGKHLLRVEAVDGSMKKNAVTHETVFYVDNVPLQVAFVRADVDHKVFQGRTLHIQFQANKEIKEASVNLLSHSYPCFAEMQGSTVYECFVPISCEEQANEYPFTITIRDAVGAQTALDGKFQVLPFPFKKHTLHLAPEKVKAEQEIGKPQLQLEEELEALAARSPQTKLWHGSFYVPADMTKISCEFGTIRTTQEKGCYMHKALDILGRPRSVVWAPQNGVVVIKDRYVQSGNTVVIDHGYGVFSLLFHLEDFANVHVGDKIKRGNPVGTIGKTGFATGYHLHWEMRINNVAVDPMQWTKADF